MGYAAFSNTRTPSPPWVHVVRLLVPMSCCDDAAQYVITALGGEDIARKLVGGFKWWQVRGVPGYVFMTMRSISLSSFIFSVDAQWVTAKKDWQEAKRRYKMQNKSKTPAEAPTVDPAADSADSAPYEAHMDEMRCILYAHGGAYVSSAKTLLNVTKGAIISEVSTKNDTASNGTLERSMAVFLPSIIDCLRNTPSLARCKTSSLLVRLP
jgi:hypothetical protein